MMQFNPNTPLKTMLFCWGPYGLLAFYAAVENANLVSPKLRMVSIANLQVHKTLTQIQESLSGSPSFWHEMLHLNLKCIVLV